MNEEDKQNIALALTAISVGVSLLALIISMRQGTAALRMQREEHAMEEYDFDKKYGTTGGLW